MDASSIWRPLPQCVGEHVETALMLAGDTPSRGLSVSMLTPVPPGSALPTLSPLFFPGPGNLSSRCFLLGLESCLPFPSCSFHATLVPSLPLCPGTTAEGYHCPPPGDLPNPGTETMSLTSLSLTGGFFTTSVTWEALKVCCLCSKPLLRLFLTLDNAFPICPAFEVEVKRFTVSSRI